MTSGLTEFTPDVELALYVMVRAVTRISALREKSLVRACSQDEGKPSLHVVLVERVFTHRIESRGAVFDELGWYL